MAKITIMGHDPAINNYGFCVATFYKKGKKFKYRINNAGILKNTLKDMKGDVRGDLFKYLNEVRKNLRGTQKICIERYQSRGRFGLGIEAVNQQIGFLYSLPSITKKDIEIYQIAAVNWKNRCNKFFILDKVKKTGPKLKPNELPLYKEANKSKIPPHIIDAFFQAVYLAEKELDIEIVPSFALQSNRTKLIRRLNEVSRI